MCTGIRAADRHQFVVRESRQTTEGIRAGRKLLLTDIKVKRDFGPDWITKLRVRGCDCRAKSEHRNQAQHREPFDNFPFHINLLSVFGERRSIDCPKLRPPTFTFSRAKSVLSCNHSGGYQSTSCLQNLTSSCRLLLLHTAGVHKKFQWWVRFSTGNKLVSERV